MGQWLLDPDDLTVDAAVAGSIDHALGGGTSVRLQTTVSTASGPGLVNQSGNGDIVIDSPLNWNTSATLALSAYRDIDFNAAITASGGGSLSLTTGTGGAGDYHIATGSKIAFTGSPGSRSALSINGANYTLLYNMNDVQNINATSAALGGYYALAHSLGAANVSRWRPIGTRWRRQCHQFRQWLYGRLRGLVHRT